MPESEFVATFRVAGEPMVVGFLSDASLTFLRIEDRKLRRGELLALASGGFDVLYQVEEPAPPGGLGAFANHPAVSWATLEVLAAALTSPAVAGWEHARKGDNNDV